IHQTDEASQFYTFYKALEILLYLPRVDLFSLSVFLQVLLHLHNFLVLLTIHRSLAVPYYHEFPFQIDLPPDYIGNYFLLSAFSNLQVLEQCGLHFLDLILQFATIHLIAVKFSQFSFPHAPFFYSFSSFFFFVFLYYICCLIYFLDLILHFTTIHLIAVIFSHFSLPHAPFFDSFAACIFLLQENYSGQLLFQCHKAIPLHPPCLLPK